MPYPSNNDAERAVLGAILRDSSALPAVMAILSPNDFWNPENRAVYLKLIDGEAFGSLMADSYVADLFSDITTAVHVEYYARIVERVSTLRNLVLLGQTFPAISCDAISDADDAIWSVITEEVIAEAEQILGIAPG